MSEIKAPKKLIEVALPLDDINKASVREKSIRHGHPSMLHLWWARRPLAAARAVLFAQLVNDPGYERNLNRGINKEKAQLERERLFEIIRKLVLWENTTNEEVLMQARAEIKKSWEETCALNKNHPQASELFNPEKLPASHDPFAGGGAIPLEAQRLGLESFASDLNPVAVVINKAMIEIPSIFNEQPPIGPIHSKVVQGNLHEEWKGSKGMAEDVRRYGAWMRDEAINRIGHLYPLVDVDTGLPVQPEEKKKNQNVATVMAWLWARTVKSPNPAFSHVDVPLATTFVISNKVGKEIYVEPIIENDTYHFVVRNGKPSDPAKVKKGTKLARGANFYCVLSDTPIDSIYIKAEAKAGRMGARLLVVVAEGQRGRLYISPTSEMESVAFQAQPNWKPEIEFAKNSRHMTPWVYGLDKFSDLFSARQLLAINTFSEIINDVKEKVKKDALASGMEDDGKGLNSKGSGATAYADAIAVYLAFALDKMIDRGSTVCSWDSSRDSLGHTFGRQAISMVWDYSEANFFSDSSGSINNAIDQCVKSLEQLQAHNRGEAHHINAQSQSLSQNKVISSDPPYYDNVPYADLSDFFYVWLRRSLKSVYPDLFASIVVPKMEELVADPFRHNNKDSAESFFLEGMTKAMNNLANKSHPAFPVTIYYAFKQSETSDVGTSSTGWETFLEAVIRAGFCITGTWPFRTELGNRIRGQSSNALASSIVLVCRKREADSVQIARRDFLRELKEHLPETLVEMIGGKIGSSPIAPVDLAQAAIGPGMAIYSNYAAILESDGSPMTVHSALQLINKEIDDYFGGQTFDEDTNFCISWFDENSWKNGQFGQAEVLARAKGTSVIGVKEAGVIDSGSGSVRLLKYSEYPHDWNPEQDNRTPVWEALHQLIRAIQVEGESSAGALLARMPERGESIRQLAYRLYTLCERKGWAEDARPYNELITAWHEVEKASHEVGHTGTQIEMNL